MNIDKLTFDEAKRFITVRGVRKIVRLGKLKQTLNF